MTHKVSSSSFSVDFSYFFQQKGRCLPAPPQPPYKAHHIRPFKRHENHSLWLCLSPLLSPQNGCIPNLFMSLFAHKTDFIGPKKVAGNEWSPPHSCMLAEFPPAVGRAPVCLQFASPLKLSAGPGWPNGPSQRHLGKGNVVRRRSNGR